MSYTNFFSLRAVTAVTLGAALLLSACVDEPPPRRMPPPVAVAPSPQPPDTRVYAYALHGQSDDQQDRDRYECHLWAVKQTGFDPSAPGIPPHQRIAVVRETNPAPAITVGAVTGALIGAAVSRPRDAGAGALIGAVAGGALGAASNAQQNEYSQRAADRANQRVQAIDIDQRAGNYRRALSACLDGRGYSVR